MGVDKSLFSGRLFSGNLVNGAFTLVACLPMLLLLIADLLAVPQSPYLMDLSGGAHLAAVIFAVTTVAIRARDSRRVIFLVCLALLLKVLSNQAEARFLYVLTLCIIFCAAGYVSGTFSRKILDGCVLALLAMSAFFASLQLVGVNEWVYQWTRHGYMANGENTRIWPVETLFRQAEALVEINTLQMRPSAIFASTQTFAGFTLFAAVIVFLYRGRSAWVHALVLGVCIAVSGSKVLVLGVPLVAAVCYFYSPQTRQQVMRVLFVFVICFILYAMVFPGVFEYTMNLRLLVGSMLVRLLDLLNAVMQLFGLKEYFGDIETLVLPEMDKFFANNQNLLSQAVGVGWEAQDHLRSAGGGSTTTISEALRHPIHTVIVIFVGILVAVSNGAAHPAQRLRHDFIILFSMLLYALTSNVAASPLYWYFVGCGAHIMFGRAFKDTRTGDIPPLFGRAGMDQAK